MHPRIRAGGDPAPPARSRELVPPFRADPTAPSVRWLDWLGVSRRAVEQSLQMHLFVVGNEAPRAERGERLLVEGDVAGLRLWEGEPAGEEAPEHANDCEYLAYVVAGKLRIRVDDEDRASIRAGGSYRIPAGMSYSLEVLERATVIEALSGGPVTGPPGGPTIADERLPA